MATAHPWLRGVIWQPLARADSPTADFDSARSTTAAGDYLDSLHFSPEFTAATPATDPREIFNTATEANGWNVTPFTSGCTTCYDNAAGVSELLQEVKHLRELRRATLVLDTSALTWLIRAFEDTSVVVDVETGTADFLSGAFRFVAARRWYRGWSEVALPAAFRGGLGKDRLLEFLRESRRNIRGLARRKPPLLKATSVRWLRTQLDRLTPFIAPNAPPSGGDLSVRAGVAVT